MRDGNDWRRRRQESAFAGPATLDGGEGGFRRGVPGGPGSRSAPRTRLILPRLRTWLGETRRWDLDLALCRVGVPSVGDFVGVLKERGCGCLRYGCGLRVIE